MLLYMYQAYSEVYNTMQMILESRVDRLENLMAEVIGLCRDLKTEAAERDRRDVERDRRFEEYIRQEKEEMDVFRQEMMAMKIVTDARFEERDRKFEEWLKQNKEAQQEQARKDKEEREKERKELVAMINKSNAENSQLLGVLVENIIAPGAKPLVRQYFKCEPIDFRVRAMKRKGANNCEVDILVICEDKAFMIEVKSKPDGRDVKKILDKAETLSTFFSECADKPIIPMLASTLVDDNIITIATRKGLYVVAYRQWEYLDILNFDALNKKDTSA
ncbi:hypothetical protein [Candidatus Magnetobacterium casense]|uniref:Uncharacterized protein n=1 Tax=Candidatus Magnetobacterium casense TaxID=1455061 RepID=A0ABS6RY96_9BACT|nr:hypothetical protein [Candidatus Magnetobacterium casensis]MBV6341614.1 hypothetical protein [Candidatus Magnetobacterium casensis]